MDATESVELKINHRMPAELEQPLIALAHGEAATKDYLFIPVYSRRATLDEQKKWLGSIKEHEQSLYDEDLLRFNVEFSKIEGTFNATPYVGTIGNGDTLSKVVQDDLLKNLKYNEEQRFRIQSIEYRDTVTSDSGEDVDRLVVSIDLSYPVEVTDINLHNVKAEWVENEDYTYASRPDVSKWL